MYPGYRSKLKLSAVPSGGWITPPSMRNTSGLSFLNDFATLAGRDMSHTMDPELRSQESRISLAALVAVTTTSAASTPLLTSQVMERKSELRSTSSAILYHSDFERWPGSDGQFNPFL